MASVLSLVELCLQTDIVYDFYRSHPKNNSKIPSSIWEMIGSYVPKDFDTKEDTTNYHWFFLKISKHRKLKFSSRMHWGYSYDKYQEKLGIWRDVVKEFLPKTGDTFYSREANVLIMREEQCYSTCNPKEWDELCGADIIIFRYNDPEKIDTKIAFCLGCGCHFFTARFDKWGNLHNQNGKLALYLVRAEGHSGCIGEFNYWHGNLVLYDKDTISAKMYNMDIGRSVYEISAWFGLSAVESCFELKTADYGHRYFERKDRKTSETLD